MISAPPVFINPQIQELYKNDLRIDHELVKEILALSHGTLIEDLHKFLYDSIITLMKKNIIDQLHFPKNHFHSRSSR